MPTSSYFKVFITLLLLLHAMPAVAQRHHKGDDTPTKPKKVYVDDESCGCELVFVDGIQTTQRNGLYGFKREDGTEIVPPTYMFVDEFHGNYCLVLRDYEHQFGMINRSGKEILPCIYDEIAYPTEGIIKVRRGKYFGYFDTTGREVLTPQWPSASSFFEGRAAVGVYVDTAVDEALTFGFIDTTGQFVLPPVYEYAYPFQEGKATVKQYDRLGVIDRDGKEVIPIKYAEVTTPYQGRVFVRDAESGLIALFDLEGHRLTDFCYNDVLSYGDGLYSVCRDTMQYFLNEKGKERFGGWQRAGKFIDGYAAVQRDGKWGIINAKGRTILPCRYDNKALMPGSYTFYEGMALVEQDGRFGFCNTKGDIVIPVIYDNAFFFSEGLAPVSVKGAWGYINRKGEEVIPFMFGPSSYFEYGRASVIYNSHEYKINPSGQCVKDCSTFPTQEVQRRMAALAVKRHKSKK